MSLFDNLPGLLALLGFAGVPFGMLIAGQHGTRRAWLAWIAFEMVCFAPWIVFDPGPSIPTWFRICYVVTFVGLVVWIRQIGKSLEPEWFNP